MDDYGYGIFYLDAMDNLDRYLDKDHQVQGNGPETGEQQ